MGYDDNRNQPTSMKVDRTNNSADKVVDYAYQYYDANGKNNNRIRQITDNIDTAYTTSYQYDDYNRLTNATASAFSRNYQFDPFGNIKNFAGITLNYATDSTGAPTTNRLTSDSVGVSYGYDAAGNMTGSGGQSYSYDGANRLKTASNGTSSYGYDGNGMRAKKTENGTTTYYIQSSALKNTAMEVTSTGVLRAFVYGGSSKLVAMQATDGQFYWLHTNHLGNSRAMTDTNGNLAYKGHFDPYGAVLTEWSSSGNTNLNSKKFTGYERDSATGLDYAQARMYNSGRGRFSTPDPIGLKAANTKRPQSLNLYSYVANDPVNNTDPTGLLLANPNESPEITCTGYGWGYTFAGSGTYSNPWGYWVCSGVYGGGSGGSGASSQIRIKPQLYFFEDASKRKVDTCAGVNYVVNWQLFGGVNLQGGINGWIVQHIKSSFEVTDAKGNVVLDDNGKPVKYTKDFYEAWQVVNGLVFSGDRFLALYSAARGTKGSFHISATVSFVWNDELTPSPSSWNGNESDANGLPNRPGNNMPQGWNESAGQKRTLDYSWDCTSPTDDYPKPTFSVTP